MEIALIHNNSLELGPMGFNVRMINSELEDLEVEERISPQSYTDLSSAMEGSLEDATFEKPQSPNHG